VCLLDQRLGLVLTLLSRESNQVMEGAFLCVHVTGSEGGAQLG
jgi:hypothetical protein